MLARGAIHNPGLFNDYKNYVEESSKDILTNDDNLALIDNNTYEVNNSFDNDLNKSLDSNKSDEKSDYKPDEPKKEDKITSQSSNKRINDKSNNKTTSNDDVQLSNKLAKILEFRYSKTEIDIIKYIKEYITIALEYGNIFSNTKYVVLYILKTHKKYIKMFQKIQATKNYKELW